MWSISYLFGDYSDIISWNNDICNCFCILLTIQIGFSIKIFLYDLRTTSQFYWNSSLENLSTDKFTLKPSPAVPKTFSIGTGVLSKWTSHATKERNNETNSLLGECIANQFHPDTPKVKRMILKMNHIQKSQIKMWFTFGS